MLPVEKDERALLNMIGEPMEVACESLRNWSEACRWRRFWATTLLPEACGTAMASRPSFSPPKVFPLGRAGGFSRMTTSDALRVRSTGMTVAREEVDSACTRGGWSEKKPMGVSLSGRTEVSRRWRLPAASEGCLYTQSGDVITASRTGTNLETGTGIGGETGLRGDWLSDGVPCELDDEDP